MITVRDIKQVYIINRSAARAESLIQKLQLKHENITFEYVCYDPTAIPVSTAVIDAVGKSHIICTGTNAQSPLLYGKWIQPGTHINSVGSFK